MQLRNIATGEIFEVDKTTTAMNRVRIVSKDGKLVNFVTSEEMEENYELVENNETEPQEFKIKAKIVQMTQPKEEKFEFEPKWDKGSTNDPLLHGRIMNSGAATAKQVIEYGEKGYQLSEGALLEEKELIKLMLGLRIGEIRKLSDHQGLGFPIGMDIYTRDGMWAGEIVQIHGGSWPGYTVRTHQAQIRVPAQDIMLAFYMPDHPKSKYYIKDNREEEEEEEKFLLENPEEILDGEFVITDRDEEHICITNGKIFLCCKTDTFETFKRRKPEETTEEEAKEEAEKETENEWIEWEGLPAIDGPTGDREEILDIRFRDGEVIRKVPAATFKWHWEEGNEDRTKDIVAYRKA